MDGFGQAQRERVSELKRMARATRRELQESEAVFGTVSEYLQSGAAPLTYKASMAPWAAVMYTYVMSVAVYGDWPQTTLLSAHSPM